VQYQVNNTQTQTLTLFRIEFDLRVDEQQHCRQRIGVNAGSARRRCRQWHRRRRNIEHIAAAQLDVVRVFQLRAEMNFETFGRMSVAHRCATRRRQRCYTAITIVVTIVATVVG
jgi:hypothetical protein